MPRGLAFYYRDFYDGLNAELADEIFASTRSLYAARVAAVKATAAVPARWLDVGCGYAHFCLEARDHLPATRFEGLDQSPPVEDAHARGWIARAWRQGMDAVADAGERFEAVSLFHYLEHTTDPAAEVRAAARLLTPGGFLMLEIPNPRCRLARLLGRWWFPWFQPQHQHLLDEAAVRRLLGGAGLQPTSVTYVMTAGDCFLSAMLAVRRACSPGDVPWAPPPGLPRRILDVFVWAAAFPLLLLRSSRTRSTRRCRRRPKRRTPSVSWPVDPDMHAVLATLGSRGDVEPILALALGLRDRGHRVKFCGPTDARARVETHGFPFVDLGVDAQRFLQQHPEFVQGRARSFVTAKKYIGQLIDQQFATLEAAAQDVDLVVGAGFVSAPSSVAEAKCLPYRFVAFSSIALPSRLHPPYLFPWMGLPGGVNAALWRLCDGVVRLLVGEPMDRNRARLGLPPMRRASRLLMPPGSLMLAADPELSPPPFDYDPALIVSGALHLPASPDADGLPASLAAFLDAGSPPVYVGFGRMTDVDPQATTRLVGDAVEQAGVRLVLGSGWASLGGPLPASCYVAGDVPHSALFPRLAGVVHHGGAGTTATAARAGVPQFLIPPTMDQFYWADRVSAAGLGPRPVRRRSLDARALASGFTALVSDESARGAAHQLGEKLTARDAVGAAVRALDVAVSAAPR